MAGREVVVGTIKSEMFMLQLPLPTTTVPNQRPRNLGSNPRPSRATTTSSLPSNLSANNTQTNKLTPSKLNTQKKNNGASIKTNNELQSSKQPFRNTNKIHSQASRGDQELTVFDSTPPEVHLLSTCHSEPVYDVTFPRTHGEMLSGPITFEVSSSLSSLFPTYLRSEPGTSRRRRAGGECGRGRCACVECQIPAGGAEGGAAGACLLLLLCHPHTTCNYHRFALEVNPWKKHGNIVSRHIQLPVNLNVC
ncbi:uncharacterized protein [Cherax quadricarinatus]|uniref:uncharacterized protein isoform X1 n=1 Tax=Cherax quadricarinatus TaxID=27406 RepID=UPI00387E5808